MKSIFFIFSFVAIQNCIYAQVSPNAVNDQFFNLRANTTYNLLNNPFSTPDNDPGGLTIALLSSETDKISKKGAVLKILSPSTIEYIPNATYAGWDTFNYTIMNTAGLKATARVNIFVLSKITLDSVIFTTGDYIDFPILNNDILTNSSSAFLKKTSNLKHGVATLNNGIVTYTPKEDFIGLEEFLYTVCDTFDSQELPICKDDTIYIDRQEIGLKIPAGISPNGDLINDFLKIESIASFPNAVLNIFNRLGDEVWKSGIGYHNDFMGKNKNNEDLPEGTYYYVLELNKTGYFRKYASSLTIQR